MSSENREIKSQCDSTIRKQITQLKINHQIKTNHPKTITDTSPKKATQMQVSMYEKMRSCMHQENELKTWNTPTHRFQWPKSKTLTTRNAGEDVEQ